MCEKNSAKCYILGNNHGENTRVVWACEEKGRRTQTENAGRCTYTKKKKERKTEDRLERCMQLRHGTCGVASRDYNRQSKVEENTIE